MAAVRYRPHQLPDSRTATISGCAPESQCVPANVSLCVQPFDHVRVMQLEGGRSGRMRGSSVKLCRGGGQLVAHFSELP
jgi:hypothetical protein